MSEMKLTDYQSNLMGEWVDSATYQKMGEKTTVCLLKLKNGFEIVGTSACVNPADYNREIGEHYALTDALSELDGYAGFYRQMQGAVPKVVNVSVSVGEAEMNGIAQKAADIITQNIQRSMRGGGY